MKTILKALPILALVLLGSVKASPLPLSFDWFKHAPEITGTTQDSSISALDAVTFALVDTSLFFIQVGKYALYIGEYEGALTFFDWTQNISRVDCNASCVETNTFAEFRQPELWGVDTIKLTPNFELDKLNVRLNVGDVFFSSPGYKHTITNNVTAETKIGEFAYLTIQNVTFGLAANYELVPDLGIQLSNVDLTLDMGNTTWTVENRYTILANGETVDDGMLVATLYQDLMATWRGEHNGAPFETEYEKWAEFVINCGLSGGRSSAECAEIEVLKQNKFAGLLSSL